MQFYVRMELHEKCMISFFPYMKIVNPGRGDRDRKPGFREKEPLKHMSVSKFPSKTEDQFADVLEAYCQ